MRAYALSVEEATKRHPAARALMECATLLGPGPLPLSFFTENFMPLMPRPKRQNPSVRFVRSFAKAVGRMVMRLSGKAKQDIETLNGFDERKRRPLSKCELDAAAAALEAFGLVHSAPTSDSGAVAHPRKEIEIHPALRTAVIATFDLSAVEAPLVKAMRRAFLKETQRGDPLSKRTRRMAALGEGLRAPKGAEDEAIALLIELARHHRQAQYPVELSVRRFEKAIDFAEKHWGVEDERLAPIFSELAELCVEHGGKTGTVLGVALFEKALAIVERTFGSDHASVAPRLSDLALALRRQGGAANFEKAKALYSRALQIDETQHGVDSPIIAIRLANLAATLDEIGGRDDFLCARKYLERAVSIEKMAFGAEHLYVALRLSSLAWMLKRLGGSENLKRAVQCLVRALEIEEATNGSEHPHVAVRLSNLALFLKEIGGRENLELAARCLERTLVIDQRAIGNADPEHAKHLSNLAMVLQAIGGDEQLKRAEHYQREALRLDARNSDEGDPRVALDMLALAEILRAQGAATSLASALQLAGEAHVLLSEALGLDHPWTIRANHARKA